MLVRQTCGGGGSMFLKLKCNQMRALQRKKPSRRLEIRFSGRTLKSTVFNEINRLCLLLKVVPQFFMELTTRVVVWYSTHIDTHRYRHTANALNRTGIYLRLMCKRATRARGQQPFRRRQSVPNGARAQSDGCVINWKRLGDGGGTR